MAGSGTSTSPLEITTAAQLTEIAVLVNDGKLESFLLGDSTATVSLKLMNDLDLSAYDEGWNGGMGWVAIGTYESPFKGIFDGNNNEITGLYINRTEDYTGLFGFIEDGTVQNLGLEEVSIVGGNCVGGVAGYINDTASLANCYATGAVSGTVTGSVGRVAGTCYEEATISDNAAFSGMTVMVNGVRQTISNGDRNGADISAAEIQTDGTIGGCFDDTSIWTVENGKLPILTNAGGTQTGDLPPHLANDTTAPYFLGDGTETAPYQISTAAQLAKLAELVNAGDTNYNDKYYKLTADLDLSAYGEGWNSGKGWIPIGCTGSTIFKGTFDGDSHKITGLYINRIEDYIGLFGNIVGTVQNLGLEDESISGTGNYVGGVAGYVFNGSVTNCAALNPSVSGTDTGSVGRVAGYIGSDGLASNNVAFSGMTVMVNGVPQTISERAEDNRNGADMSTAQIKKDDGTIGGRFNDTNIWTSKNGKLPILKKVSGTQTGDLPPHLAGGSSTCFLGEGTEISPYQISTAAQLAKLAELVNDSSTNAAYGGTDKYYKLTADLDLSAYGKNWNGGKGWIPIGCTGATPSKGNFDGDNHKITGLYINRTENYIGLFGFIVGTVQNLGLKDESISGTGNFVGGVAGYVNKGSITNCYATGTVSGIGIDVGGVAGLVQDVGSVVSNCYATGAVSGTGSVGCVAGIFLEGTISDNVAFSGMTVMLNGVPQTITDGAADNINGADISAAQIKADGTIGSRFIGDDGWTSVNGKLPILKNVGGTQSADGGLYLITHDIASVSATVDGTYTYTGNPISPTLKVTFGKQALEKDVDYIVSITSVDGTGTSAGTKAGTVTLTLTGIGRFTGTKTGVTFRIENQNQSTPGGGDSSSDSGSIIAKITPEKKPNQPVTAATPVTATAGTNGAASASISDKVVSDAIAKAQADAKAQGKTANGISVELNITMPKGTASLTATLTRSSLDSLVSAGVSSLEINGSLVKVSFDKKALAEIQKQRSGNISIAIAPKTNLSDAAKKIIGTRPIYDITVGYGSGKSVSTFGGGIATVYIPYILGKNEAVGGLYAVYVDEKGNATPIAGSAYDANSGCVIFTTPHFSQYGIGYTAPTAKFMDISTHWGKESIDYVVGRGIVSGITETTFAPDSPMTRGMLVTAFGKLEGVDTKTYTMSSFTDVKADSAYRPYIEWAYSKGIIQGIGNSQFAPDRAITREEIAVIFANYAKATSYTLPITREASVYADASSIGSAYRDAVKAMQQAGIMMGGSDNQFNPKGNATRAEVSSMLNRYIKLTINPATAQGWAQNDAGQYLYYKDGKALTGTQTIDGVKYFFNTDGTLKTGWVKDGDNWRFYSGKTMLVGFWDLGANGNNKTYYFTKDGLMISGKWLEIDGKWYYFNTDGSLAKSTKIDDYEVDANGVRTN
ncbi:S-layer homology domain protein [anaerobic digester metagenome]